MQVVAVFVVMVIDSQAPRAIDAEQLQVGGDAGDELRMPGTADVPIQAQHVIGGRHHQM